jgi:hypothetical protein
MATMYPAMANSPSTVLYYSIDSLTDVILVADSSKLPDAPNIATIGTGEDAETIFYADKAGDALIGVTRGFQGTAKEWIGGTPVARYFTAYDYDAVRENIENFALQSGFSRKNILHNWDFRNPVNQRGQTVYTGSTPTIDRWKLLAIQHTAEIVEGGIKIIASGSANVNNAFGQVIENYKAYEGKEVTISCKILENTTEQGISLRYNSTPIGTRTTDTGIISASVVLPSLLTELMVSLQFWDRVGDSGKHVVIESVKMEVGLGSTLANDHPADYGEQLALCKRFYRLWTTEQARTEALKEVGLMRLESPTFGTINIGGTTYYYANAEL